MKKLTLMALMLLAFVTSNAQEDVSKKILKLKNYNEAEQMLNANLGSMTSEQKAKSYNKLVELAMAEAQDGISKAAANEMAEQTGQPKQEFDEEGMYNSLYNAFQAAYKCDEFDNQPNEKGKVKVKFHNANRDKLYPMRAFLINGGIYYQNKQDNKNAYKYLAGYVDSADEPLFAGKDKAQDANLLNIAYYAAVTAYMTGAKDKALKYAELAMQDPEKAKDATVLKLAIEGETLKTKADSVNYVKTLEDVYRKDTNNEQVFGTLVQMYSALDMDAEMSKLFDEVLAKDPKNFTVWAVRGQNAMAKQDLENAITYFKNALEAKPNNPQILSFLGACLLDRASQAEDKAAGRTGRVPKAAEAQILPIFEEAKAALEKAKQLDPQRENSNWAYALYRCYYRLYGANDQRTIEAEAETKM